MGVYLLDVQENTGRQQLGVLGDEQLTLFNRFAAILALSGLTSVADTLLSGICRGILHLNPKSTAPSVTEIRLHLHYHTTVF